MDLTGIAAVVTASATRSRPCECISSVCLPYARGWTDSLQTVAATIAHLEKGIGMPAEELFDGFRFTRQTSTSLRRSDRAMRSYRPAVFRRTKRRRPHWSDEQFREVEQNGAESSCRLLALLREGVPADDPSVLAVLDDDVAAQRGCVTDRDSTRTGTAFATAPELRAHLDARIRGWPTTCATDGRVRGHPHG